MVAALVIPVLFLYFLYLRLLENKKGIREWQNLNKFKEEACITGKIIQLNTKNEKFVGRHSISKTTIIIQYNRKLIKAINKTPITTSFLPFEVKEGMEIKCYGYWDKGVFLFSRLQIIES